MQSTRKVRGSTFSSAPPISRPNQTFVAFFHLPPSKWRRLWSGLGKHFKASYSLPVCLFLNLWILARFLFSAIVSKFVQGAGIQRRRKSAPRVSPGNVTALRVCNTTRLNACSNAVWEGFRAVLTLLSLAAYVQHVCGYSKNKAAKCHLRIKWSAALRVYLLLLGCTLTARWD